MLNTKLQAEDSVGFCEGTSEKNWGVIYMEHKYKYKKDKGLKKYQQILFLYQKFLEQSRKL